MARDECPEAWRALKRDFDGRSRQLVFEWPLFPQFWHSVTLDAEMEASIFGYRLDIVVDGLKPRDASTHLN